MATGSRRNECGRARASFAEAAKSLGSSVPLGNRDSIHVQVSHCINAVSRWLLTAAEAGRATRWDELNHRRGDLRRRRSSDLGSPRKETPAFRATGGRGQQVPTPCRTDPPSSPIHGIQHPGLATTAVAKRRALSQAPLREGQPSFPCRGEESAMSDLRPDPAAPILFLTQQRSAL